MRRAILIACLLLGACGGEIVGPPGQPDMTGDWAYTWEIQALSTMHGKLTLVQTGDQIMGSIAVPDDFNPTEVDPRYWDWNISGPIHNPQITVGPGCACSPLVPFDLQCQTTAKTMTCPFVRTDDYGVHPGTFSASR